MNIYIEKNGCKRERLLSCGREFREEIRLSSTSTESKPVIIHAIGKDLSWCFPGREFILSSENCDIEVKRGYMYPCSFLSILEGGRGGGYCTTIIVEQPEITWMHLKKTGKALEKSSRNLVNIEYVECDYFEKVRNHGAKEGVSTDNNGTGYEWEKEDLIQIQFGLTADYTGEVVIHIIREKGDFHKGLDSYKKWYQNKHGTPQEKPFAGRFQPIVLSDTRSVLNIYRFLFPRIKYIRIIHCDLPIGDNPWEINKSFFNGEGLWLDNDPEDLVWYPDHIKKRIREQYRILRKYADAIDSDDVEPLHAIESDRILCNRFTGKDKTLLTLINPDPQSNQLYLPKRPGRQLQVVYLPDGCRQMEDEGGILITLAPRETAALVVK